MIFWRFKSDKLFEISFKINDERIESIPRRDFNGSSEKNFGEKMLKLVASIYSF